MPAFSRRLTLHAGRRFVQALVLPVALTAIALPVTVASAPAAVAGRVIDIYPGGRTLQAAVASAVPGDIIALHAGTHRGQVIIRRSGTAAAPITIRPAGDGPVTVTADFPAVPCNNAGPVAARTIKILDGADYWTIYGLRIVNGIWVSGLNGHEAGQWFKGRVQTRDWQSRRALPGRGSYNTLAAQQIYAALGATIHQPVDPAEGMRFIGNDISGRGLHIITGRRGEIAVNNVHDIDCGIGPGIWVNAFSDFWHIYRNTVRNVAASDYLHYMQEGIRLGTASNYNVVEWNAVTDLPGDGRAITTDRDASWNLFQHNYVTRTAIAYNDQEAGWGNRWVYNTSEAIRGADFTFRGADAGLKAPNLDRSTYLAYVACNRAATMSAGTMMRSNIRLNYFTTVRLSKNLRNYWTSAGNFWEGHPAPPAEHPWPIAAGIC